MLAVFCPGQGSQFKSFLTPWIEIPSFKENLELLSEKSKIDLIAHGTISAEETIQQTSIAQPLIVAAGICSFLELNITNLPSLVAGHSVGEITAGYVSKTLSQEEAISLATVRGKVMEEATKVSRTGMSAILGKQTPELIEQLDYLKLAIANYNDSNQIVVAGDIEMLQKLAEQSLPGNKIITLKVAGAFHTPHMRQAQENFSDYIDSFVFEDPHTVLLSNNNGKQIVEGKDFSRKLVRQISSPVRWDLCMENVNKYNISGILEVTPGGTLANIAKRNISGVEVMALKNPNDLEKAKQFIQKHQILTI